MRKNKWITGILALLTAAMVLFCSETGLLLPLERTVADLLYSQKYQINNSIKIITIDQQSEAEYGYYSDWTRARAAELVETLTQPDGKPAVVSILTLLPIGTKKAIRPLPRRQRLTGMW